MRLGVTASALLLCVLLVAGGCGGDSSTEQGGAAVGQETTVRGTDGESSGEDASGSPDSSAPDGSKPSGKASGGKSPGKASGGESSGAETEKAQGGEGERGDGTGQSRGGEENRVVVVRGEPRLEAPEGTPPKRLVVVDIARGRGAVARRGDKITIRYLGIVYETGEQFDSTWERNQTFTYKLGSGLTVPGFERGVEGMRVGGRRKLIVPPRLAYGARGLPPKVPPNSTLVFVVDLIEVR